MNNARESNSDNVNSDKSNPYRPAPQYGEYASDEEMASAIKRSGGTPPVAPTSIQHAKATVQRPAAPAVTPMTHTVPPKNAVDRIVTVFLLAFGLVYVVGGISTYLNLGVTLQETVKRFGMGDYQPTSQTASIGIAMIVSQTLFWLIAAVWSYRRISRRKISWWVPVVLGVISFLVLAALLGSLLAADPSFMPKF